MTRFRLLVEYHGAPYSGWQFQPDRPSVQGVLQGALASVGEPDVVVYGAGRTDAGVHALAQVAHVDVAKAWTGFDLANAVNSGLKGERVAVLAAEPVPAEWHARFSATARAYVYRIVSRRASLTLEHGLAWNVKVPLSLDAMNEAAGRLTGLHDFTTFRSTECQSASPVKTLDVLRVRETDGAIVVEAEARSFLHNQVRSLVGALEWVGRGKWTPDDVSGALEARDRRACAPVAPAHGLYLARVDYPTPGP